MPPQQSLVREFSRVDDPDRAGELGLPNPYLAACFDMVPQPAL